MDATGTAVGSSPLPDDEGPVEAMVSAVAEAVSDAIEAVTDHLAPADAAGSVGDDGDSGPVDGLDTSGSPTDEAADVEPAVASTVAAEGAQAAEDDTEVIVDGMSGEVEQATPAEEVSAAASAGMEAAPVSSSACVDGSVPLGDEVRVVLQWHVDVRRRQVCLGSSLALAMDCVGIPPGGSRGQAVGMVRHRSGLPYPGLHVRC